MATAKQSETFVSALKDYEIWYWENYSKFIETIEKVKNEAANSQPTEVDELVGYHNLRVSDLLVCPRTYMFTTHINIEGKIAMDNLILTVLLDMAKKLDNGCGVGLEGAELHNELCNQTQFCEDRDDAKKFLGEHAFDAIRLVKEWEEAHMGEVHTNFSCPCCVANMFAYCVGDYALCYGERLEGRWD